MNFDQVIEKIEDAKDISAVKRIVENTSSNDREAVKDYALSMGWEV